jgi:hypothetical protein
LKINSGLDILLEMKEKSLEENLGIIFGQILTPRSYGRDIREYEKFVKFYNKFLK